ncbi:hypothetical protein TNCV_3751791 [Trichonephila clavipes]|nr:hypothetical protein TNCV_3751791 [Trichonephila clavipes]
MSGDKFYKKKAVKGRKRCTTSVDDRRTKILSFRDKRISWVSIRSDLSDAGVSVSSKTIRRRLADMLYMAIILYAPALALNVVTGLSKWSSVYLIGFVCTFYSTLVSIIIEIILPVLFIYVLCFSDKIVHSERKRKVNRKNDAARMYLIENELLNSNTLQSTMLLLLLPPDRQCKIQVCEIHHGKRLDCTPVSTLALSTIQVTKQVGSAPSFVGKHPGHARGHTLLFPFYQPHEGTCSLTAI